MKNSNGQKFIVVSGYGKGLVDAVSALGVKNVSLKEFQVRYLALFPLFLVIDSVSCVWMGSLHKNIQSHGGWPVITSHFPVSSATCLYIYW